MPTICSRNMPGLFVPIMIEATPVSVRYKRQARWPRFTFRFLPYEMSKIAKLNNKIR